MQHSIFIYLENRYYELLAEQRAITSSLEDLNPQDNMELFMKKIILAGKLELAEELLALEKK